MRKKMKEGKIPKIILCRCMREYSQVGLFLGFPIHILISDWKQQFCMKVVLFLLYSVVTKHGHLRTVNQVLEEHVCTQDSCSVEVKSQSIAHWFLIRPHCGWNFETNCISICNVVDMFLKL